MSLNFTQVDLFILCSLITEEKLLIVFCFRDLSYNQLTGEIPFNIGFLQVATLYVDEEPLTV